MCHLCAMSIKLFFTVVVVVNCSSTWHSCQELLDTPAGCLFWCPGDKPQGTPALCVRSSTPPSQPRTTEEAPVWPTGHNNRSRVFYTAGPVRHKRNGRQGVRTIPENVGWTSGGEEWRPPLFSGDEPSSYETDDVHPPMEYHVFSWLPFIIHPEKVEPVCNSVPSSLPKINFTYSFQKCCKFSLVFFILFYLFLFFFIFLFYFILFYFIFFA